MNRLRVARLVLRLSLICLPLFAVEVRAQDGPPPPMGEMGAAASINVKKFNAERELARLTKKYKLTEEQKAKIQPILVEQQAQVHTLGENEALSDTEWVSSVRKVHLQAVLKIKALMTDAQATKYVEDEKKQAKSDAEDDATMGPPDGPPPGPPPGNGGTPPGE